MSIWHRLLALIQKDLSALWPGSTTPLNREAVLHLLLYAAILIFSSYLFVPLLCEPRISPSLPPPNLLPEEDEKGRPNEII